MITNDHLIDEISTYNPEYPSEMMKFIAEEPADITRRLLPYCCSSNIDLQEFMRQEIELYQKE